MLVLVSTAPLDSTAQTKRAYLLYVPKDSTLKEKPLTVFLVLKATTAKIKRLWLSAQVGFILLMEWKIVFSAQQATNASHGVSRCLAPQASILHQDPRKLLGSIFLTYYYLKLFTNISNSSCIYCPVGYYCPSTKQLAAKCPIG